jgi:putative restriction endonuclease
MPVSLVWETYGLGNGAATFREMRDRLVHYRRRAGKQADPRVDFRIGCILVHQPIFFPDGHWVREPDDFPHTAPPGKSYDLTRGEGARVWMECLGRAADLGPLALADPPAAALHGGFGTPQIVMPRLGQRSFRFAVLDAYGRRCSVTNERTLPALEAAHIRDYSLTPEHSVANGLLLRADLHKLFDAGYVTVTPEYRFEVSGRIKEEFENGRDYYALHGSPIRLPERLENRPLAGALAWHNEERFRG